MLAEILLFPVITAEMEDRFRVKRLWGVTVDLVVALILPACILQCMVEYKLDVTFNSQKGAAELHVFDMDGDEPGSLDSCTVGEDLDSPELSDAWVRYHETEQPEESPTETLFVQILSLIENHTHDELEAEKADLEERRDRLKGELGVDSLQKFREDMEGEELSAEELRERQNIASTWEAIDTELMLVGHAIRMHQDVSELKSQKNPLSSHS